MHGRYRSGADEQGRSRANRRPRRAGSRAEGRILISDAFFPFPDGIVQAAEAGASLVVRPGGSIRDEEVIAEAEARGLTMVFTHHRLFRH